MLSNRFASDRIILCFLFCCIYGPVNRLIGLDFREVAIMVALALLTMFSTGWMLILTKIK